MYKGDGRYYKEITVYTSRKNM